MESDATYGNNGAFKISRGRTTILAIASDGEGWEHVSIRAVTDGKDRTPTWAEMCFIKDLFWEPEDCAIQYHPAQSQYVNTHKHVLHLWRPINQQIPTPNKHLV